MGETDFDAMRHHLPSGAPHSGGQGARQGLSKFASAQKYVAIPPPCLASVGQDRPMDRYQLHYAPDNASLIIRLALEELGQGYDTLLVDRSVSAQRGAEYTALNPAGRIPTLETPDGPISETAAILLWLSDRHRDRALLPAPDAPERGAALNWLFYMSNTVHADLILAFYPHRYVPEEALPAFCAATRTRLARAFGVLHDAARPRLGPWLCGPEPSALDLYLAAQLRWVRLYSRHVDSTLDLTDYPAFADMCARLDARPSVRALCNAEGMADAPFSHPTPPTPPEGSAI